MAAEAAKNLAPIVAPHILNAIAGLSPKLKGPRKLIKQLTGFASRQTSAVRKSGKPKKGKRAQRSRQGGAGGALVGGAGGYVHTVNAPVAFAHTTTARPGFYIKHIDADTIIVHSVDFVKNLTASATANAFQLEQFGVDPVDATLFTYLAPLLDLYTKYKMTSLKMHYVHACGTSVPGQVMLTWCADPNTTVPTQQSHVMNTNDAIAGSCYEDFAYEVNSREFQNDWQYISDFTDADEDDRLIRNGIMFIASVNCPISQPLGSFMVESEWILTGRRDPALAPMMAALRTILRAKGTIDSKEEVAAICAKRFIRNTLGQEKMRHARPTLESAYECLAAKDSVSNNPSNSSDAQGPKSNAESIPTSALKTPTNGRR